MQTPIYAVGDIHGQIDMMRTALDLIEADGGPDAKIVFLGDYVDRGPDSRGVLQTLIDGQAAGRNWITLKGNHDRYLSRFLDTAKVDDSATRSGLYWFNPRLGGDKTLASYGVEAEDGAPIAPIHAAARAAVPRDHWTFVDQLPLYHVTDDLLFVHAGIRPNVALSDQVEDDLIWIRDGFLTYEPAHPWLVVHGHTALEAPEHFGNRIDLDGGAGFGRPLFPAVFEGRTCWLLTPGGRVPLTPAI